MAKVAKINVCTKKCYGLQLGELSKEMTTGFRHEYNSFVFFSGTKLLEFQYQY